MVDSSTTSIEALNGGRSGRIYLEKLFMSDSAFPFRPNQGVRIEIVETSSGNSVLAVVPDTLEVDQAATEISLERSTRDVQAELEANGGGGSS